MTDRLLRRMAHAAKQATEWVDPDRILAVLDAQPAPALDEEALARALDTETVRRYVMEAWVDEGVSQPGYATPDEMARAIAAAYDEEVNR